MAKDTCEMSRALSIGFLKKHGYLNGRSISGTVTWTSGWSERKSSIGIIAYIDDEDPHFRLHYTHTDFDGGKSDVDYRVRVTTTPCFFGGRRYWFVCPLSRNDVPCQRRVGVLYGAGKYYGCRRCYDLAYHSQQETHTGTWAVLGKCLFSDSIYEKIQALRTKYWRGQPTKRHATLLKKIDRLPNADLLNAASDALLNRRSQK